MRYHNITKDDMLNGDGLRVVLWISGCSHHCHNCQNPITWDADYGLEFDDAAKEELFEELSKPYVDGITLSGGDPLFCGNRKDMEKLIDDIRANFPDKSIWMYTGYEWKDINNLPLIKKIDILVDGKYIEELRDVTLMWRGSSNQHVIDVKKSLKLKQMVLHCE